MTQEERQRYYDFEKYLKHIGDCRGGGDQCCHCGMAELRANLEDLLDELQSAKPGDRPQ